MLINGQEDIDRNRLYPIGMKNAVKLDKRYHALRVYEFFYKYITINRIKNRNISIVLLIF